MHRLHSTPGTGTEPKRTGSGQLIRTRTGTEPLILINKVPEPNRNFEIK